jgi:cation transport ATPase
VKIQDNANPTQHLTLLLYNLRCSSDAHTVERLFGQDPGVATVYANPATEKIYIEYDAALTHPDRLRAILQQSGFGPKVETR